MAVPIGTIFSIDLALLAEDRSNEASGSSIPSASLVEHALEALDLSENTAPSQASTSGGSTCLACGIGAGSSDASLPPFSSAEEQRLHFKTDWHRYNVKRRLAGLDPVTEQSFFSLIESGGGDDRDVLGSLSGSDSDASSDEEHDAEDDPGGNAGQINGPQFVFAAPDQGKHLAVWRCLVAADRERKSEPPSPAACLSELWQLATGGGRWAVILFRGGHFSAAILEVTRPTPGGKGKAAAATGKALSAAADAAVREIVHKSFHKYVVRAKAGGKQSTKDASGKFAKSAGSRLRRHNEMALHRDVTETLTEWKGELESCSLILVAAPGSNGKTLMGGDAPLLPKGDPKVRKVPFVTRRPTLSEIRRVARVLLTAYDATPLLAAAEERSEVAEEKLVERREKAEEKEAAAKSGAAAQEAAEEAARAAEVKAAAKKAEKRNLQKQRQREKRQAEAAEKAESAQASAQAAHEAAEDEIARVAAAAAAAAARKAALPKKPAAAAPSPAQASVPARLSSRPLASEDAASRRARMAAAAEARAKALAQASSQQRLR